MIADVNQRINGFDVRFNTLERKLTAMEGWVGAVDEKLLTLNGRVADLDLKLEALIK